MNITLINNIRIHVLRKIDFMLDIKLNEKKYIFVYCVDLYMLV